jgi:hypothetical protein
MVSVFTFLFSVYGLIKTENLPGDLGATTCCFYPRKRWIKTASYSGSARNRPLRVLGLILGAK